jgi:ketosteroid isomerase-like protein
MRAEVLAVNEAFYEAFRAQDAAAMEEVWAERAPVACAHPGWPMLVGRADVLASWRDILRGGRMDVRCAAAVVHALGPDAAFVTCVEVLPEGQLAATNVFVREDGAWRMVHHHAGPAQPIALPEDPGSRWN